MLDLRVEVWCGSGLLPEQQLVFLKVALILQQVQGSLVLLACVCVRTEVSLPHLQYGCWSISALLQMRLVRASRRRYALLLGPEPLTRSSSSP